MQTCSLDHRQENSSLYQFMVSMYLSSFCVSRSTGINVNVHFILSFSLVLT
jgi:hypothetical protein